MQPQVGVLALGAVVKKPAVVETPTVDAIAIRHKMFLSHSYDHRVVDGSLGGMFVRRVADYLERFGYKPYFEPKEVMCFNSSCNPNYVMPLPLQSQLTLNQSPRFNCLPAIAVLCFRSQTS